MTLLGLSQLLIATIAILVAAEGSANHRASGALSFPVRSGTSPSSVSKRDQDIKLYGNSTSAVFYIQLYVGSPEQQVKLIIDTGSDETWVNPNCSISGIDQTNCLANGIYRPADSSTSNDTQTTGGFEYADGSSVDLIYYTDTITFTTGLQVPNAKFGVATTTTGDLGSGILGLGFGESTENTNYQNFVDQLASQKITNSKAFSLALGNGTINGEGVIIFGGVDTKKFSGQLVSNNILGPQYNEILARYWIQITSVGLNATDGTNKQYPGGNAAAVIDAGTTITFLPNTIVTAIAQDFNATFDESQGGYSVSCSKIPNNTYLSYSFGAVTIKVPLADINIRYNGDTCFLGIQPANDIFPILGLNFIRYAYIVFDQTLNTISLAQYTDCGVNEQDMPSSGAAGFVGECASPVTVTTNPSTNSSSTSPTSSQTSIHSNGLSSGAKAGIGVGVAVGVMAIVAALLYFFVISGRRKQAKQSKRTGSPTSYPELAVASSSKQEKHPMAEAD